MQCGALCGLGGPCGCLCKAKARAGLPKACRCTNTAAFRIHRGRGDGMHQHTVSIINLLMCLPWSVHAPTPGINTKSWHLESDKFNTDVHAQRGGPHTPKIGRTNRASHFHAGAALFVNKKSLHLLNQRGEPRCQQEVFTPVKPTGRASTHTHAQGKGYHHESTDMQRHRPHTEQWHDHERHTDAGASIAHTCWSMQGQGCRGKAHGCRSKCVGLCWSMLVGCTPKACGGQCIGKNAPDRRS